MQSIVVEKDLSNHDFLTLIKVFVFVYYHFSPIDGCGIEGCRNLLFVHFEGILVGL